MEKINKKKNIGMFLIAVVFGLIAIMLSTIQTVESAGAYSYYRSVTIESDYVIGGSSFTDFPIVISETIADLATTANGGDIENTVGTGGASGALTVPADFDVGSDTDCSTSLDYEFESYPLIY